MCGHGNYFNGHNALTHEEHAQMLSGVHKGNLDANPSGKLSVVW